MKNKINIEQAFEEYCGCNEKNGLVFYCEEYRNYHCPRVCHYAIQKLETETRESKIRQAEYAKRKKLENEHRI